MRSKQLLSGFISPNFVLLRNNCPFSFQKRNLCSLYPLKKKQQTFKSYKVPRTTTWLVMQNNSNLQPANQTTKFSTIPLILTWFRVLLIPLLVTVFYLPISFSSLYCFLIFLIAAITDWFDGYLARKWNCTSSFGSFLDPVADKLLVAISLVLLSSKIGGILIPVTSALILCREIFVSALREWMAIAGKRESVSVGSWGKVKTAVQMISICQLFIFVSYPLYHWLQYSTEIVCLVSCVLSIYSAFSYLMAAIQATKT